MAPQPLLSFGGKNISRAHTLLAGIAFSGAFLLACLFNFKAVCKNEVAGWPIEWFPSVSATIGDHIPSRPFFQIAIALCSGPRFLLILGAWLVTRRDGDNKADWVAVIGVLRTFSCGGWVYITSSEGHDFHDFAMIIYLLLTLPWMFGTMAVTQQATTLMKEKVEDGWWVRDEGTALKRRRIVAGLFFGTLVPLIYFYLQHKVHRVPGSYTYYSLFEWSLIVYDVAFDAISAAECSRLQIQIIDIGGRPIKQHKSADGPVSGNDDSLSGYLKSKHGAPDSWYTLLLEHEIQLNEPILPPSPVGPYDSRMEWPPHLSGWGGSNVKLPAWREGVAFLVDVFLAYCFWTIFTVLGVQLFYWSVWKLALSGSELMLFMILSPWFLSYPEISRFATSKNGQSVLRGIALGTALTAYALPTPLLRLFAVSIANVALWLEFGGTLSHLKGESAKSYGLTIGCGLLLSLLFKLWNYSNNPLWCIVDAESGGWNKTGLVLALLAWIEKHYRGGGRMIIPEKGGKSMENPLTKSPEKPASPNSPTKNHAALLMGFGNLIFILQTIITDAGTVIAWSWTGYPVKGPELLRHGFIPIVSASLGFLLSTAAEESWLTSTGWSMFGCVSCFLLVQYQDWIGFMGGCALIIFATSLFPLFLRRLSAVDQKQIGAVLGKALLANAIWDVVSVLTVAYAFVPGGQLFRERMDIVMYFSVIMVCWGLYDCRRELHGPVVGNFKTAWKSVRLVLVVSAIAAWLLCQNMWRHMPAVVPYHSADTRVWTGGIWAVHFGIDEAGHDSQSRMLQLIRDMEVDVIGLLETDLHRFVYGNRDLTRMIAEELGYYVDLGPGPNSHTWGAVMLSKFPILESTHHLLPSPHGELAPAIFAKLLIHGQTINVIVSHNGQEEDPLDRELQSTALAKIMSDHYPEPFAFLGYLVTHVGASRPDPYEIIMADGKMWDVEIEDRNRWCQYIAFRNMWRVAYARITHGEITDTELQVARWVLPAPDETVSYQSNEELYRHWWEEDVDEAWRFTRAFRGNGTRGHRYEIFDGPIYYLPPKQYIAMHDVGQESETNDDDGQEEWSRAGPHL